MLQVPLSEILMSSTEILQFVKVAYCYSNISIVCGGNQFVRNMHVAVFTRRKSFMFLFEVIIIVIFYYIIVMFYEPYIDCKVIFIIHTIYYNFDTKN